MLSSCQLYTYHSLSIASGETVLWYLFAARCGRAADPAVSEKTSACRVPAHTPSGRPLSLHEGEGCLLGGRGVSRLELNGEGVRRKVKTEWARDNSCWAPGMHCSPNSLRMSKGAGCVCCPGGGNCPSWAGMSSKLSARGLTGDPSRGANLGFLLALIGVHMGCRLRPCGVPFLGYKGLLTLP